MSDTSYTTVSGNLWKWDKKQQRQSCPACGSSRVSQRMVTDHESDEEWPENQRMKYECAGCSWTTTEDAEWSGQ